MIEIVMALVSPVGHSGFPWLEDPIDKRPLSAFAVGEKDPAGNTSVEIKTDMSLGLFGTFTVVGPIH